MVVPKRHARRSVTRNLVKREMRSGLAQRRADLPPGDWVLRLRAPIDVRRYPSASSEALRGDLRRELAGLISQALEHAARSRGPVSSTVGVARA